MERTVGDYKPGEMDISMQKESFDSFWSWTVRTTVICILLLGVVYWAFA